MVRKHEGTRGATEPQGQLLDWLPTWEGELRQCLRCPTQADRQVVRCQDRRQKDRSSVKEEHCKFEFQLKKL
jgi:hypothetical protein